MEKFLFGRLFWAILGLVVFAAVFLGYQVDSSYYIPTVLNNADHNLFPTDFLVNSQSVYHTLFFGITGYLVRYFDWQVLFLALSFATSLLIAFLIFYLSLLLFKDKITAYLSVFLLLISKGGISLTGIGIHQSLFEPSIMVIPFSLFSIYLFLKEKYRIACLITGLMFYIHGVEAFSVAAMFLFYFLVRIRRLPKLKIFQSVFLLFLPVLLIAPKLFSAEFFERISAETLKQWLAILHYRSFWHLFPFSWGPGDYFNYLGWFLWAFIVLRYSKPSGKHDTIIVFCKALALLCLMGTIFVEIFPVPIIIKLMLWRSSLFFVLFLIIYITNYLVGFSKGNLILKLLGAGTISALFFSITRLIVCFAFLHLAFELRKNKFWSFLFTVMGLGGIFGFSVFSFLTLEGKSFLVNKFISFTNLGAYNIIFFYLFWGFLICFFNLQKTERNRFSQKQISLLILSLTFVVLLKFLLPKDIGVQNFRTDWIKAQIWVKENTPIDAVFITPPYLEGFRIHSQRGIVTENKDGGVSIFDISFSLKWWERMNDLGYSNLSVTVLDFVPECKRNYSSLTESQLRHLGKKYNALFIVVERPRDLNFKLVYQNKHFKVYSIGDV